MDGVGDDNRPSVASNAEGMIRSEEVDPADRPRRPAIDADHADLLIAAWADGEIADLSSVGPPDGPAAFRGQPTFAAAVGPDGRRSRRRSSAFLQRQSRIRRATIAESHRAKR